MKKRILPLALSIGMMASTLAATACGGMPTIGGNQDVEGKTTIRVATYNGGVGKEWLEDAAKRFEEKYANKSFEDGKTGVAVKVSDSEVGDSLANKSLDKDVYLTEVVDYYYLLGKNKLADISDVVTGSLSEYGEDGTIAGKLDSAMSDFLTAQDGKYYGLPFYDGFYGFIYDVDMFEAKGWFFDANGNFTKTNKSVGRDGVAGTYDDGMPATYKQFAQLVEKIRLGGVTVFSYATESMNYFSPILSSYWADYEGKAKMQINWSLDGEIDVIESFDADGNPVIGQVTINGGANYKELQKQPGKYYALSFLKDILMSDAQNYKPANTFKMAQARLIESKLDGAANPTAMVIDGSWFENEATMSGAFDDAQKKDIDYSPADGEYKKTRRFAFMPIPTADDSGSGKQTLVSANDSFCFVSSATKGAKLDVAKEFVKFLHSDAELGAFTAKTSITRPFTYEIDDTTKATMSYYGKALMEMKSSSDIVYPYSSNEYYVQNSSTFVLMKWSWNAKVSGKSAATPFDFLRKNSSVTAKAYFEGLYKNY